QPAGGARRGSVLFAKATALSSDLLPGAPPGDRVAVDSAHRARTLARVASRRAWRSAAPLPRLLGARPGRSLHARRVEAPLLPPSRAPRSRADRSASDPRAARRAPRTARRTTGSGGGARRARL